MAAEESSDSMLPSRAPSHVLEVIDLTSDDDSALGNSPKNVEVNAYTNASAKIEATEVEPHEEQQGSGQAIEDTGPNAEDESEEQDSQWSMYEDILDGAFETDDNSPPNLNSLPDCCTREESVAYRRRLRLIGADAFQSETIGNNTITAKKLCTAFGVLLPPWLEGATDEVYYRLLEACIAREISRRSKLPQYNTIEDAIKLLQRAQNIIVLTGAGISTSLGIPDFRSKETGLYSRLEHLGLSDPQEVFDLQLFREDPSIFYSVAKDILPLMKEFSPTHAFIRMLQDRNKLLTNFTQNIDNLEEYAGIQKEKLIQCHGSFATATCSECRGQVKGESIYDDIRAARVPYCKSCVQTLETMVPGLKRKRSSDGGGKPKKKKLSWYESSEEEEDDDIPLAGVMKPDITFFGEDLPAIFHNRLVKHDRALVDLVIVIGTSLKVAPVSEVVDVIPSHVPQIYISREPCSHVEFDIDLLGDCDTVVTELARRAGWDLQHKMTWNGDIDVQLHEGHASRYSIKQGKA